MPRIALIGGYTAGHVFPMLALAEAYRAHDARAEFLFIGGRDSLEASLIAKRGYTCHAIGGAPLFGVTTRLGLPRRIENGRGHARTAARSSVVTYLGQNGKGSFA